MSQDHCEDCGLCCKKLIIEIGHIDVVREPLLKSVVVELDNDVSRESDWDRVYGLPTTCSFLSPENRCTIYKSRPNPCVAFEVGGEHCNELREEHGLPLIDNVEGKQ